MKLCKRRVEVEEFVKPISSRVAEHVLDFSFFEKNNARRFMRELYVRLLVFAFHCPLFSRVIYRACRPARVWCIDGFHLMENTAKMILETYSLTHGFFSRYVLRASRMRVTSDTRIECSDRKTYQFWTYTSSQEAILNDVVNIFLPFGVCTRRKWLFKHAMWNYVGITL